MVLNRLDRPMINRLLEILWNSKKRAGTYSLIKLLSHILRLFIAIDESIEHKVIFSPFRDPLAYRGPSVTVLI